MRNQKAPNWGNEGSVTGPLSFTATQFALLSAFSAIGRVWVGPMSGVLAESVGWPVFFLFSTVMALPGLLMLCYLRERIQAVLPRGCRVVVLDERGTALTTQALARQLTQWQLGGDDVALIIGGPDGLEPAIRDASHQRIRLSDHTLPHAMVRVLLIEQLYRAWSINANHPYHRE